MTVTGPAANPRRGYLDLTSLGYSSRSADRMPRERSSGAEAFPGVADGGSSQPGGRSLLVCQRPWRGQKSRKACSEPWPSQKRDASDLPWGKLAAPGLDGRGEPGTQRLANRSTQVSDPVGAPTSGEGLEDCDLNRNPSHGLETQPRPT